MPTVPSNEELREAVLAWLPTTDYLNVTRKVLTAALEKKHDWNLEDKKVLTALLCCLSLLVCLEIYIILVNT